MAKHKFTALIRETDPTEGLRKYECEIVGLVHASGLGGATVEEALESAKESIRNRSQEEDFEVPDNIQVITFEMEL